MIHAFHTQNRAQVSTGLGLILTANYNSFSMSIVSAATKTLIQTVSLTSGTYLGCASDGVNRGFVVGGTSLKAVDLTTYAVTPISVSGATSLDGVAYGNGKLAIADSGAGLIKILDGSTYAYLTQVNTGGARGVCYDAATNKFYTTTGYSIDANSYTAVAMTSNNITGGGLQCSTDGNYLVSGNAGSSVPFATLSPFSATGTGTTSGVVAYFAAAGNGKSIVGDYNASGGVVIFNNAARTVAASIARSGGFYGTCYLPAQKQFAICNMTTQSVEFYNAVTNAYISSTALSANCYGACYA